MKPEPTVVAVFRKNDRAEIRVTLDSVRGKPIIHARTWYRPRHFKDDEPMIPTKRGLAFTPEKAGPLAAALLEAAALCLYKSADDKEASGASATA